MVLIQAHTLILRDPRRIAVLGVFALLYLTGCTNIPELDATVPRHLEDADYPNLVPIETLLTPMPAPEEQAEELRSDLTSRRDNLQNRASRLNAPVVDAETRSRMQAGVAR